MLTISRLQFTKSFWKNVDQYRPGQRYMCNFVCHKHELCMVNKHTQYFHCVNKHDLRVSRRMFTKMSRAEVKPPHESFLKRKEAPAKPAHMLPVEKQRNRGKPGQEKLKAMIDNNTVKIDKKQKAEINVESDVIQQAAMSNKDELSKVQCSKSTLASLRRRLADWFGVVHAAKLGPKLPLKHHTHKCDCTDISIWMFHQLDANSNLGLTHREMSPLESNDHEKCLRPLLTSCDHNRNNELSRKEWCCCFSHIVPPCLESKQHSMSNGHLLIGAYIPQCDENGYFSRRQCHGSTGQCWCADLNGNKVKDTSCLDPDSPAATPATE